MTTDQPSKEVLESIKRLMDDDVPVSLRNLADGDVIAGLSEQESLAADWDALAGDREERKLDWGEIDSLLGFHQLDLSPLSVRRFRCAETGGLVRILLVALDRHKSRPLVVYEFIDKGLLPVVASVEEFFCGRFVDVTEKERTNG